MVLGNTKVSVRYSIHEKNHRRLRAAHHDCRVGRRGRSGHGSGLDGSHPPKDVITARQELMEHIEELMEPIDTIQVRDTNDLDTLRHNGEVISAMLLALPHLFPPTTNLYDPKAQQPETLALSRRSGRTSTTSTRSRRRLRKRPRSFQKRKARRR